MGMVAEARLSGVRFLLEMAIVRSVELFFQEGTSDKVYNVRIEEDGKGLYTVHCEWGRRGAGSLNTGTKAKKVPLERAEREYEKVVREKTGKGYQAVTTDLKPAAVAPPAGEGSASRIATTGRRRLGQAAQLLNAIEEDVLESLLADDAWIAQQKLDGNRVIVHVGDEVIATNRQGQVTQVHASILDCIADAPRGTVIDGELVSSGGDPCYWAFDLLQHGDEDLRTLAYRDRYAELDALLEELPGPVKLVPTAWKREAKKTLLERLEATRAEGIVFKKLDSPYTPGRPASGGNQLKYKFVKTADVFLTENAGNAYRMAVYDGKKVREVGKVFAGTTNEIRKELDERISGGERPVAAVEYLYATDDDQLFQPVFLTLRDDKEPGDCVLSQLVKTNREVVAREKPAKRVRRR